MYSQIPSNRKLKRHGDGASSRSTGNVDDAGGHFEIGSEDPHGAIAANMHAVDLADRYQLARAGRPGAREAKPVEFVQVLKALDAEALGIIELAKSAYLAAHGDSDSLISRLTGNNQTGHAEDAFETALWVRRHIAMDLADAR